MQKVPVTLIAPDERKFKAHADPEADGREILKIWLLEIKAEPGFYTMSVIGADKIRTGATIAISRLDQNIRHLAQLVVEIKKED